MSKKNNPRYTQMMREERQAKLAAKGIVRPASVKLATRIDVAAGKGSRANADYSRAVNLAHRCGCPPCAAFTCAARALRNRKSTKAQRRRLMQQREPCARQ